MQPYGSPLKKERHPNAFAITSLVLAIVPFILGLLLIILLLLVSGGTLFGGVAGALWPVFLILLVVFLILGFIADILAVIFGVIAIRKQKTFFSWLGIIIVAVEVLIFIVI